MQPLADNDPDAPLPAGKIPPELLARLLRDLPTDTRVVQGPGIGHDAAVIDFGDRFVVLKTDPVTFPSERAAWYAVQVNANDIACLGAEPRWFLATLLLPPGSATAAAATLFADLRAACAAVGAVLVGGHTEVTSSVTRPVITGAMIGEVARPGLRRSDAAQAGDLLLQLGPVAIEGTALLAREMPDRLRRAGLSAAEVDAAQALLFAPGISVLPAARLAWTVPGVHALHDPTEGGLATACWEMASAAGLGVVLERDRVRVHPLTARISAALAIDPLGLLASGALLLAVAPAAAEGLLARCAAAGIEAARIGRLGGVGEVAILDAGGKTGPLPRFVRDEVVRVMESEAPASPAAEAGDAGSA